ncbi:MAG: hypothetical protein ABI791_06655 [Acidobacteriota bacterium]
MKKIISLFFVLTLTGAIYAQQETLANGDVAAMTAAGLSADVIITKIQASKNRFDVSTTALIELKKAGVPDNVITLMLSKQQAELPALQIPPPPATAEKAPSGVSEKKAITAAATIAFSKSSLQPSLSALEKELLKRPDWRGLNLTIVRYQSAADLSVEISFVHGSVLTHRYTYSIFDRRSGTVVGAGETTSWGSLAENLARHIAKGLTRVQTGT